MEIPITALVVTYNEGHLLKECLARLSFVDQLIVIDLGSSDNSVLIAEKYGAEILTHTLVPIVEMVWPDVVGYARNDWIIRVDPDEIIPKELVDGIFSVLSNNSDIGALSLPHQYYFLKKPIYGTKWGGITYSLKVFNKNRVTLDPLVHRGITVKMGSNVHVIEGSYSNAIMHFWVNSISELFVKHWRYILHEGQARYCNGESFHWKKALHETFTALRSNLIAKKGLNGGLREIFLSFFYAWYVLMCNLSLFKYSRTRKVSNR